MGSAINRNTRVDGSAAAGMAFDLEPAAEERGTFAHADKAEATGRIWSGLLEIESMAVVLNDQDGLSAVLIEGNAHLFSPGMLENVVESLLGDPVEIGFDVWS